MAFVKLDCGILNSTIWDDREARELFITALLMAEPFELKEPAAQIETCTLKETGFIVPPGWYGFVPAAGVGIIRRCGFVDIEAGKRALERLGLPEDTSRTPDFDGRRLVRVDGGFIVLNFTKYREKDATTADRSRRWRQRQKDKALCAVTQRRDETNERDERHQAEAEAEAEASQIQNTSNHQNPSPQPASGVNADALMIYDAYPRKQGKQAALKTIVKVLKNVPMNRLLERTNAFAEATKSWSPNEQQFIPHPATWFNRGSYDDDPETWVRREHSNERRATFA